MFTREAAKLVFRSQHVDRWAFDIEILYLCSRFNVPCKEASVTWTEIEGSKIDVWGVVGMARDILFIRILYFTGVWHIEHSKTE